MSNICEFISFKFSIIWLLLYHAIFAGHIINTSKVFLTSNEDFRDRHLSYWSSSHFFKDERPPTISKGKKNHSSNIGFYIYCTIIHNITNTISSILTLYSNACNILFALSLCLVNIKSQVREYQKNKKKHPHFDMGYARAKPRVQSASTLRHNQCNRTIEKSFLFSFRLFRYAYNHMTRGCIL